MNNIWNKSFPFSKSRSFLGILIIPKKNGFRNRSLSPSLTYKLGMSSTPAWLDAKAPLKHGVLFLGLVLVLFMQPQGFGV